MMASPSRESSRWSVGSELPTRQFGPITLTDIVRYQGASGDLNPMHHDDGVARSAGYPEAFSVGMLQGGYLATYCVGLFGSHSVRRFRTRFHELVWRGDVLTAGGRILAATDTPSGQHLLVELSLSAQTGKVVVDGEAEFDLDLPS